VTRPAAAPTTGPAAGARDAGHLYALDLVRVLTFACVIAVHTVVAINPPDSVPAGGAAMLLHFTREAFVALTAFVLVHRYRASLHVVPFWRRRFLLIGTPYLVWSVIYTGLALSTTPLPPTAALTQLGINLLTGTACYHLYFLVVTMQCYLLFPCYGDSCRPPPAIGADPGGCWRSARSCRPASTPGCTTHTRAG
jgi:surface polysaccharide O-acyltransferase-like enzyme